MIRMLLTTSALLFASACADGVAPAAPSSATGAETGSQTTARSGQTGETAPYVIEGDVVKVNNRICAVSRSPMGDETLGQHVSRVRYDGPDSRFAGKTLEFNQCCPMCLDRFPQIWAERRDEIMRYHGLVAEG